MKIAIVIFLELGCLIVVAQERRHFTRSFQDQSLSATEWFRLYFDEGPETVSFQDFRKDTLVLEGWVRPMLTKDSLDQFIWFIRNQLVPFNRKSFFQELTGEFHFHGAHGRLFKAKYDGEHLAYYHIADQEQSNQLSLGNGSYTYDVDSDMRYMEFEDSLIVKDLIITASKGDTIYNTTIVDRIAAPADGFQSFYATLSRTINYPFVQRLGGEEGRIYVQFDVDKTGKLMNFQALGSSGKTAVFERKTIKKLDRIPPWRPAYFEGKPVKTRFVLPVIFRVTK